MSEKQQRVKMTFRCVEYHTIERNVDSDEWGRVVASGDIAAWLDEKFRDDSMPDSDINTVQFELESWETVKR